MRHRLARPLSVIRPARFIATLAAVLLAAVALPAIAADDQPRWVTYEGGEGPGNGKHIVLVSGDEEYRSEEALPQLGKILSQHHGFTCTVLFAIDEDTGEINPNNGGNIPGLEALADADLMIIATRFRNLPDEQMQHIDDYITAGKPVIGLRTATHGFNIPGDREYHRYSFNSQVEGWEDGFGRQILGETWINHHGAHGSQATRGVIAPDADDHPITNGISDGDIFGPTDVYGVRLPMLPETEPLVLGQVVDGMDEDDPPLEGEKNDPMMPIAWLKDYQVPGGEPGLAFCSTMGSADDLLSAGLRRLLVNASYYLLNMDVPSEAKVDLVGDYDPTPFAFDGFVKGVYPADHELD